MSKQLMKSRVRMPNTRDMNKLNTRQREFVALMCSNPTMSAVQAAKAAGYKAAQASADKCMKNPIIKAAISATVAQREIAINRSGEELLKKLWEMFLFDPAEVFDYDGTTLTLKQFEDIPIEFRRAMTGIKVRKRTTYDDDGNPVDDVEIDVRWMDKMKLAELLAKHHGLIGAEEKGSGGNINVFVSQLRAKIDSADEVEIVGDDAIDAKVVHRDATQ